MSAQPGELGRDPSAFAVGVAVESVLAAGPVRIGRWRCVVGSRESTAEFRQSWHLVSLPHEGAFQVESGSRSAIIDSVTALLVNADVPFRMRRQTGPSPRGSYLLFEPETLEDACADLDVCARSPFTDVRGAASTRAFLLQAEILGEAEVETPDRLSVEGLALELLSEILAGLPGRGGRPGSVAAPARRRQLVDGAKEILARRYRDSVSLAEIALDLAVSPFHLCHMFKRETGQSLSRYRNALRLREALERLASGSVDLGELALYLGFSSHSHFTSVFRREFGRPPSEIAAALRDGTGRRRMMAVSR